MRNERSDAIDLLNFALDKAERAHTTHLTMPTSLLFRVQLLIQKLEHENTTLRTKVAESDGVRTERDELKALLKGPTEELERILASKIDDHRAWVETQRKMKVAYAPANVDGIESLVDAVEKLATFGAAQELRAEDAEQKLHALQYGG